MKKSKKVLIIIFALVAILLAVIVAVCCLNNSDNDSNIKLTIDQKDFDTIKSKTSLSGTIETSDNIIEITYEGYQDGDVCWSGKGKVNGNKWNIKEVFLVSGKNEIVITAKTDKGSTTETINIYYDTGTSYTFDETKVRYDEETGITYVNNILLIIFEDDVTEDEIPEIIKPYNGEIAGRGGSIWDIKIDEKSYKELKKICYELEEKEEVFAAMIDMVINTVPDTDVRESMIAYKYWEDIGDWGYEAMEVSSAYNVYNDRFSNIKIGVVDTGFDLDHEDLNGIFTPSTENMEGENDYKEWNEKQNKEVINSHGTHVAGIIGAMADNKGITGILKKVEIIYSDWQANTTNGKQKWETVSRIFKSLENSVTKGAKVVNYSLGCTMGIKIDNTTFTSEYKSERGLINFSKTYKDEQAIQACKPMEYLLNNNYDFVVVQASGNGTPVEVSQSEEEIIAVDATNNGYWCCVTEDNVFASSEKMKQDILNRIIVVGNAKKNSDGTYQQATDSNGGTRVDICAPGTDIFSTTVDDNYGLLSGTSMAAPQVTGVCGLVWSVNPNFTGAEVKEIVCNYTSITVNDNPDGKHPLNDTYKMVNAKLAVEEAIRRTDIGYGTVTAFVKETDTDKPLNNVYVTVDINGSKHTTVTDETGKLRLTLPVGTYTLTLKSDNFVTKTVKVVIEKSVETVLLDTIYLATTSYLMGTVVDKETNKAVEGASVLLRLLDGNSSLYTHEYTCFTDKNGQFSINIPAGTYNYTINTMDLFDELYETATGSITVVKDKENSLGTIYLTPKNNSGGGDDNVETIDPNRTVIASGDCGADGDNVKWTLYDDGELVISGSGKMNDYSSSNTPWYAIKSSITKVTVNNGITSIGDEAFSHCYNLENVTIPDSVTNIGYYAFGFCDSLIKITVDNSNLYYSSDSYGVLYNKDKTELIAYPIGNPRKAFGVPEGVIKIHEGAFRNCQNLTSITIPQSVVNIQREVFYVCEGLSSITVDNNNLYYSSDAYGVLYNKNKTELIQYPIGNNRKSYIIPNSVLKIGYSSFSFCKNITSITIPINVAKVETSAFLECINLGDVYYTGTEAQWNNITIDTYNSDLLNATIHYNS